MGLWRSWVATGMREGRYGDGSVRWILQVANASGMCHSILWIGMGLTQVCDFPTINVL